MAGEIGAVDLDRRGRGKAVDRRRHVVGVARERAAQIRDQRVALPIGRHEQVGRDDIGRRADRLVQARRVGVVACGELEPALDQEAAGIVADRAECILVELEAAAQRLAGHVAGQRRRHRCLVRGLGGRRRDARRAERSLRRCRRHRRAGADRALRLRLSGIELRLLSLAVERIVAGGAGAIGGRQAVERDLVGRVWVGRVLAVRVLAWARRRLLALAQIGIGIWQRRQCIRGCLRHARGPARRQRVGRCEATAVRTEQIGGEALGRPGGASEDRQRKARQSRAQKMRALAPARAWRRPHDGRTPTKSNTFAIIPADRRELSLMELKQLWLTTG